MNILIINPNSDENTTEVLRKKAEKMCAPDVNVTCIQLKSTPKLISGYEDCAMGAAEIIELVKENNEMYDGFIVACFSDPNVDVLKEITDKPVIGIAEAAMRFAAVKSDNYALISTNMQSAGRKKALARKYYCNELMSEIVVPKSGSRDDLIEAVRETGQKGIKLALLGCANYVLDDSKIEEETGVTVYDGLACAIGYIETMVRYRQYKQKAEK